MRDGGTDLKESGEDGDSDTDSDSDGDLDADSDGVSDEDALTCLKKSRNTTEPFPLGPH